MRYNENDGTEVNGRVIITSEIDDNPIFEISCVVAGDMSVEHLRANYDLIILGNVEATRIDVAGSFCCMGDCSAGEIAVQGSCSIGGNLSVTSGFVGEHLSAKEICAEKLEAKGSISCTNLECNGDVTCDEYVLISEGLMGSGSLSSKMTLCGEYSLLEDTTGTFVADTLQMELPVERNVKNISKEDIDLSSWERKAKELDATVLLRELEKLSTENERFKNEYSALKKILVVENIFSAPNIKAYVDIMDLVNKKYLIISKTEVFKRVKEKFESFSYDDINHSKMPKITQRDFAKMLYILMYKPQIFTPDIRELLLDTLYICIGTDYEEIGHLMEE